MNGKAGFSPIGILFFHTTYAHICLLQSFLTALIALSGPKVFFPTCSWAQRSRMNSCNHERAATEHLRSTLGLGVSTPYIQPSSLKEVKRSKKRPWTPQSLERLSAGLSGRDHSKVIGPMLLYICPKVVFTGEA